MKTKVSLCFQLNEEDNVASKVIQAQQKLHLDEPFPGLISKMKRKGMSQLKRLLFVLVCQNFTH